MIGPVGFSLYGLMVALGAVAGLLVLKKTAPAVGWSAKEAGDLGFWLVVAGLMGARIFYVLFHLPEFASHPIRVFQYWRGGLMFQGAVFASALSAFIYFKKTGQNFWARADAVAPALALGQALGRIGCYSAGCCYGLLASPTWPIRAVFPPGGAAPAGLPLYPVQLMECLGLLLLFFTLLRYIKKGPPRGRIFGLYLLGAGLLRAVMEQFRGDFRGPEVGGQAPTFWLALTLAALGLWGLRRSFRFKKTAF
jgi:phosphatidylglycerol:prolipoprotein diacylglycerol transferase